MKEAGVPLNNVFVSKRDIKKVKNIPIHIKTVSIIAPAAEFMGDIRLNVKKAVIMLISIGNLPLQGTNEFVKIATSLSLFESIIRHPTTPAALQPKPIHIVKACFPQAPHFLKIPSRLKEILGR